MVGLEAQPTNKKIHCLWNRPESLLLTMVKHLSINSHFGKMVAAKSPKSYQPL